MTVLRRVRWRALFPALSAGLLLGTMLTHGHAAVNQRSEDYFPVSVLATLATVSAGMQKPMFSAPVCAGGR